MKSHFPLHTRNQRGGKALLTRTAKCRSQLALGPKKVPFEFLSSCAYSGLLLCFSPLLPGCGHALGALPTTMSTRCLPSPPWWDGVHDSAKGGHLRPTLRQCWENPCHPWGDLPTGHRRQQENTSRAALLVVCRLWRPAGPGLSHLLVTRFVALCIGRGNWYLRVENGS